MNKTYSRWMEILVYADENAAEAAECYMLSIAGGGYDINCVRGKWEHSEELEECFEAEINSNVQTEERTVSELLEVLESWGAEARVAGDDRSDVDDALESLNESPDLLMYSWWYELEDDEKDSYIAQMTDIDQNSPYYENLVYQGWQEICQEENRKTLEKIVQKWKAAANK